MAKVSKDKDDNSECEWIRLREAIKSGAETAFGFHKASNAKKPWVTDKMMEKMDERRKWKRNNTVEGRKKYLSVNNELRRETDKVRQN